MSDDADAIKATNDRAARGGGTVTELPPPAPTSQPPSRGIQLTSGSGGYGPNQGIGPDWFSSLDPLSPIAPPEVSGRLFDYPSGYNLQVQPRAYNSVNFYQLRWLADGYDLLRLLIETRKDQMERQRWTIQPRDPKKKLEGDLLARANKIEAFLMRPDKEHFWGEWLRMLLEDMIVLDAASIYRRRTRGGDLYALDVIDGGTIKRVIDDWGRTPIAPTVAYQQVLKGFPAVNYSTRDLIYSPRNKRSNRVYGYGPVEQVIMTVNIALRRQMFQLAYYTEGNVPESLIGVPETWCYTEDTEVLTKRGWIQFADADVETDLFATRGAAGKFEWQKATSKNVFSYDGELVSLKSRTIDCAVNPQHRVLLTRRQADGSYLDYIKPAADVLDHSARELIPVTSVWGGTEIGARIFGQTTKRGGGADLVMTGDQFCAFMGAWLAEGSCNPRNAMIAQRRDGKAFAAYERLIIDLVGQSNYGGKGDFRIGNAPLARYLEQFGTARDKFIPDEIMDATPRQIAIFLRYFALGDGDRRGVTLYTSSRRLADQLQELVQKAGKSATIAIDDRVGQVSFIGARAVPKTSVAYRVHISQSPARKFSAKSSRYVGKLGCVSVPNTILYVRRNGKPCWSGNTPDQIRSFQDWFDSVLQGDLGARRRARFIPGGVAKGYTPTKSGEDIWGTGDEWLARVCCFALGMSPQPFVKMMNRSTAGTAQEQAEEEGLAPVMAWVKRVMDGILIDDFGETDLEFGWVREDDIDEKTASEIAIAESESGQITINEARKRRGEDPFAAEIFDKPMVKLNTGWEFIDPEDQIKYGKLLQDALGPPTTPAGTTGVPADGGQQGDQLPAPAAGQSPAPAGGAPARGGSPGRQAGPSKEAPRKKAAAGGGPALKHFKGPAGDRPVVRRAVKRMTKGVAKLLADAGDDIVGQVEAWLNKRAKAMKAAEGEDAQAGLYVCRNLTPESASDFTAWAQAQGFGNLTPANEMHATVVYSRVDLRLPAEGGTVTARGGVRTIKPLGDKGAIVLTFECAELKDRWQEAMNAGASWDYPTGYQPHVTISYDAGDIDLSKVEPYEGDLEFGAEHHAPVNENWAQDKGFRKVTKADETKDDPLLTADEVDAILKSIDFSSLDALQDVSAEELEAMATDAATQALVLMGVTKNDDLTNQVNDRAVKWAQNRSAELVGKRVLADGSIIDNPNPEWAITPATRDMVRATIDDVLKNNLGRDALIDKLQDDFAFSPERALMIARTEIAGANSVGAAESYREARDAGVDVKKEWILGPEPCQVCEDNADEGPIDLDDDFPSGDGEPPAHPNCECSLSPVADADAVEGLNSPDAGDGEE